jgi:type II secretory pathway component PulF
VGLSLVQALNLIREQTEHPYLKTVIDGIVHEVTEGRALHEAMSRYPEVFDSVYVNSIKAGESSGRLDEILNMLCYFSEQQIENTAKIKSATFYPKIILGTIGVVLLVVIYFVIPRIKGFYTSLGGELPAITLFVLGVSDFFLTYWYLVLATGLGIHFGVKRILAQPMGRYRWDAIKLKAPVFGTILLQYDLLIFSSVLHLLLRAGIPIIEAFRIVRDSLTNQVLRAEVEHCRRTIENGQSIASGFQESRVFPKMVGNLISVGEESGKIDEVLLKISSYYKVQLEYRLNNLSKAIEPFFLFAIFGIVLVLVLSIFMPIWKMSQLLRMK